MLNLKISSFKFQREPKIQNLKSELDAMGSGYLRFEISIF